MGLTDENRKDIVTYRIERAFVALEQAKGNLEINIQPTEDFIVKVSDMAKEKLS